MNNDTNKKEINSEEQPQTKKPFIIRLFALILLIGFVILLICYIYMLITGSKYSFSMLFLVIIYPIIIYIFIWLKKVFNNRNEEK